jgi:hypothetical protein
MPTPDRIDEGTGGWRRVRAALGEGARAIARFYFTIGGVIGGLVSVGLFVATWAFCIANFGTVFGVAMGWIPAVIAGVLAGVILRRFWGPLAVAAVLLLTAPAWDKGGGFERLSVQIATGGRSALAWTTRTSRHEAARLERVLRREGLWPEPRR